jgi:hypothetical protein
MGSCVFATSIGLPQRPFLLDYLRLLTMTSRRQQIHSHSCGFAPFALRLGGLIEAAAFSWKAAAGTYSKSQN